MYVLLDDCKQNHTCPDSNQYFNYNEEENNLRGIYGTNGSCILKLGYKDICKSHESCNGDLVCSDTGCTCSNEIVYYNGLLCGKV
jgi:hypothetical protein